MLQAPVILCLVMNEFLGPNLIALGMLGQLATWSAIDAGSTSCRILPIKLWCTSSALTISLVINAADIRQKERSWIQNAAQGPMSCFQTCSESVEAILISMQALHTLWLASNTGLSSNTPMPSLAVGVT